MLEIGAIGLLLYCFVSIGIFVEYYSSEADQFVMIFSFASPVAAFAWSIYLGALARFSLRQDAKILSLPFYLGVFAWSTCVISAMATFASNHFNNTSPLYIMVLFFLMTIFLTMVALVICFPCIFQGYRCIKHRQQIVEPTPNV
ncbi:MAG: hypothetical protein Harvfovirus36_3 [Harvfovirus sp.]|uniref:Transmembrane protein n=1 Tax=Harvfovirus sp. TaxID=2487768 RepID=A0A3G5A2N4_9VIRU|nr:MAG: hypothetical protein Harvfovirus36_3 [Harvfovirus sp.]